MQVVSLVVLLVAAGALDDNQAYQEGISLYQELEYEQAIFRFEQAALSPDLTDGEKAMVFGWMAMAYAGIGDAAGAKRSLDLAVAKDPAVTLPGFAPPKVKEWLEEARGKAKTAAPTATPAPESPTTTEERTDYAAPEREAGEPRRSGGPAAPSMEVVEEFVLEPEQPEESGSGGVIVGLLMMGAGVGALLVGGLLGVPSALFWFDYYGLTNRTLPDVDRQLDDPGLGPTRREQLEAYRGQVEQAAQLDLIGGIGFAVPAAALAALGLLLVGVGAGTATFNALE